MTDLDKLVAYIRRTLTDFKHADGDCCRDGTVSAGNAGDSSRNLGVKNQRLELLAERFLQIAGQESQSDSIASIETGNRTPGGAALMM